MTIGKFKFAFLPLLIVGCGDEHSFHYDYQGRLLNPDGSAAANVELYVTHLAGLDFVHSSAEQDREFWKYWGTTTDQGGRFHGEFNAGGTYSKWLGVVPPEAPPAKQLDAVYVVVRRDDEWLPILLQLDENSQRHGHDGGRHIDLPAVTLPERK